MLPLLHPRFWGAHLIGLLATAAAVGLGLWQYDAWADQRAAEARDLTDAGPLALTSVMSGDDPFPGEHLGRPVQLAGEWLDESTLFVADRRLDGRTGYWVVTPVLVAQSGSAMPVVRGWSEAASAPAATGAAEVTGWLQAGEGTGRVDEDPHDRVIPEMRVPSMVEHVDADLYSGYVVARSADPGLRAVTPESIPEVSATTALRNLLYALEWWVFAVFAVCLWWRWCRDALRQGPGQGSSESAQERSLPSAP